MKKLLIVFVSGIIHQSAFCQGGLNSIYSAYGIGDVELRDKNGYAGMSGAGIALPSTTTLNEMNPASYGHFPYSRFMFELNFGGRSSNYKSGDTRTSGADFTIQRAAMGFSLFKGLGTAFGLKRYSTIDYRTTSNRFIIGTESKLQTQINGSGGLYQFFVSNGYSITKNIQLGISMGYLFGSVNKKEIVETTSQTLNITQNQNYTRMLYNTGIQYSIPLKKGKWTIGLTYQPGRFLQKIEDNYVTDGDGNELVSEEAVVADFNYPVKLGAGLAYSRKDWKWTVDLVQQRWGAVNYKGAGFTTDHGTNLVAGFSKSGTRKTVFGIIPGKTVMAGVEYDRSYLVLAGNPIQTIAGSIGMTLPSKNGAYYYHIALKAGQRGQTVYPLVREQFFETQFAISLGSLLYKGGRKYD
jgi:hypothetical protein